jgi:hypothetical protein
MENMKSNGKRSEEVPNIKMSLMVKGNKKRCGKCEKLLTMQICRERARKGAHEDDGNKCFVHSMLKLACCVGLN